MNIARTLLAVCLCGIANVVAAHGGGLNAEGCHNDRGKGGYHCHRGASTGSLPAARNAFAPAQSLRDDGAAPGAYASCATARAAGAAPVRRGDPGYGGHLDRDGDGVGCE